MFGGKQLALALGGILAMTAAADAQEDFDNPSQEDVACLAIKAHNATWRYGDDGGRLYSSKTKIENLCRMALEFRVCVTVVDGEEPVLCQDQAIRPLADLTMRFDDVPGRITGPDLAWRYMQ